MRCRVAGIVAGGVAGAVDRLGGGEIGAADGEEIGAEGGYVIVLGGSDLVYGSRAMQRWSSDRTNNLIGLFKKLIVDA